jgi:hypothetical protein
VRARERRLSRAAHRLEAVLAASLRERVDRALAPGEWESLIEAVAERRSDPYRGVESLLGGLGLGPREEGEEEP